MTNTSGYGWRCSDGPRPGSASTKIRHTPTPWSAPTISRAMLLHGRSCRLSTLMPAVSRTSIEAVAGERLDELALLVGEVREQCVGQQVHRPAHPVDPVLLGRHERDERRVDA